MLENFHSKSYSCDYYHTCPSAKIIHETCHIESPCRTRHYSKSDQPQNQCSEAATGWVVKYVISGHWCWKAIDILYL